MNRFIKNKGLIMLICTLLLCMTGCAADVPKYWQDRCEPLDFHTDFCEYNLSWDEIKETSKVFTYVPEFNTDENCLYLDSVYHKAVQRTDEDVTEVYNEILQRSSEQVAQNPETESAEEPTEVSEPVPDENSQPDETVPVDETPTETEKYSFVGITYKHEDLNLTFKLHTPDENGYPTEISLNGVTYSEVTFDNNTYALSNVSITEEAGAGANVTAYWYVGEQEYMLNIQESGEDSWKMFSPGVCSGYYYPE